MSGHCVLWEIASDLSIVLLVLAANKAVGGNGRIKNIRNVFLRCLQDIAKLYILNRIYGDDEISVWSRVSRSYSFAY